MLQQTSSQTIGPFFHFGLVRNGENILVNDQTAGQRLYIRGYVRDGDDQPIPDALVEIWQADAQGIFNHPSDPRHERADPHFRGYGRSATTLAGQVGVAGEFSFKTIKPGRVAWNAEIAQAPHVNLRIFARGLLIHVVTRLYFSDESANQTDPVLMLVADPKRRQTLIAQLEESADLPTYRFDIRLQGEYETVFFDA